MTTVLKYGCVLGVKCVCVGVGKAVLCACAYPNSVKSKLLVDKVGLRTVKYFTD